MIRNAKTIFVKDFTGGVNCVKNYELIEDNEFVATPDFGGSYNFYYKNGCIQKTKGYTKINSTTVSDTGVAGYRWYFTNLDTGAEQTETICAFENSTTNDVGLYRLSGTTFTAITGGTTITNPQNLCFASWKNNLYIASGVAPIQKINVSGTTWTRANLTSTTMALTNPSYVLVHKDRLWINGSSFGQIGQVECSGYDDDDNWSGTEGDVFNTNYGDGDKVVAIKPLNDRLIIYKYNSIWVLEGDNLYNWQQRANQKDIGCIAPYSIQDIGGVHIFLGEDNLYAFDGENILPIGDSIKDFFYNINKDNLNKFVSCVYDGYYYLAMTSNSSSNNNVELLFSVELFKTQQKKSFYLIKDRPIASYILYTGSNDSGDIYAISSSEGYFYKVNHSNYYDTENIKMIIQTKFFTFDTPMLTKEIYRLRLNVNRDYDRAALTLIKNIWYEYQWNYLINYNPSGSSGLWDISNWDDANWATDKAQQTIDIAVPSQLDCYSLSIVISHTEPYNFELYNTMLIGTLKEM